jgi:hypothetical protein
MQVRQVGLLLDEVDDVEIYHFCAHAMVNLTVLENVRAYLDDQVRSTCAGSNIPEECSQNVLQEMSDSLLVCLLDEQLWCCRSIQHVALDVALDIHF